VGTRRHSGGGKKKRRELRKPQEKMARYRIGRAAETDDGMEQKRRKGKKNKLNKGRSPGAGAAGGKRNPKGKKSNLAPVRQKEVVHCPSQRSWKKKECSRKLLAASRQGRRQAGRVKKALKGG